MTYQSIFWLDDNPGFLVNLERAAVSSKINLDLKELLKRVTFAFDFQDGKRLTQNGYDLYILGANFPQVINPQQKGENTNFLEQVAQGRIIKAPSEPETYIENHFVNFYLDCLGSGPDVVIFSRSRSAIGEAFDLYLPFYSKDLTIGQIEKHLEVQKSIPQIKDWEHGDLKDFVKRYLI